MNFKEVMSFDCFDCVWLSKKLHSPTQQYTNQLISPVGGLYLSVTSPFGLWPWLGYYKSDTTLLECLTQDK